MRELESKGNTRLIETDTPLPITGNLNAKAIAIQYQDRLVNLYFYHGGVGETGGAGNGAPSDPLNTEEVRTSWYAHEYGPKCAEVRKGDNVVTVVFDSLSPTFDTSYGTLMIVQFSLETGIETGRWNFNTNRFEQPNPPLGIAGFNVVGFSNTTDWCRWYYKFENMPGVSKDIINSLREENIPYEQALNRFDDVFNPGSSSQSSAGIPTSIKSTSFDADKLTGVSKQKDVFQFSAEPGFVSKVDQITNFSAKDKDVLQFSKSAFGVSTSKFTIAKKAKDLKKALATDTNFIYNQKKGELIFNANGAEPGFGDDGGVFALLVGQPKLLGSSVSFI